MPAEVVTALSFQDHPQEEPGGTFSLASALYIADHLASRKAPPDDFGVEEWNMPYLRTIGCQDDISLWRTRRFRSMPAAATEPRMAARKGLNLRRGADFICVFMLIGTYTAIVTPFRDGKFDAPAFKRLIAMQVKGGVDGIVPVAPPANRRRWIQGARRGDCTRRRVRRGRIRVMAGTAGIRPVKRFI